MRANQLRLAYVLMGAAPDRVTVSVRRVTVAMAPSGPYPGARDAATSGRLSRHDPDTASRQIRLQSADTVRNAD